MLTHKMTAPEEEFQPQGGLFQLQGDAAERGEVEKDGLLVRFEWDKHPVPPQGRLGYQRATIVFPAWHFSLPCPCF